MKEGRLTPYDQTTFTNAFKGYFGYTIDVGVYKDIKIYYRQTKKKAYTFCLYTDNGGFYRSDIDDRKMRRLKIIAGKTFHIYEKEKLKMHSRDVDVINFYLEHLHGPEFSDLVKNITIMILYDVFDDYDFVNLDLMSLRGEFFVSCYIYDIFSKIPKEVRLGYQKDKSVKFEEIKKLSWSCKLNLWPNLDYKKGKIELMLTEYAIGVIVDIENETQQKKKINSFLSNIYAFGPGSSTFKKSQTRFKLNKL